MQQTLLSEALARVANGAMTALELVGATEKIKQTQGSTAVAELYKAWVLKNPEDPLLYAILFNYSAVQTELGDWQGARESLERSIALNGDFAPSRINLGRVYEQMGTPGQSVSQWSEAVAKLAAVTGMSVTHKTTALNQMARVLEGNNQDVTAKNMLRESLEIDPSQREVVQHYLAARQRLCEWPLIEPWERVSRQTLMEGLSPLSLAVYTDDPMLQLALNAHYNKLDVGAPASEPISSYWAAQEAQRGRPIRVGYLSSDLREHAIGFLMAEMLGLHDPEKIEVFVYYCGIPADDGIKQRIKAEVPHWISIAEMDDATAAQRIADDGIQILIDVNGYTRDARTKLLALRPAPVIVNWLGFPGTMASPYHHYIIADSWIIPPEHELYFSEKVLRLPCYQPNDSARIVAPKTPTRAEAGLPEKAMVYCCFNGTQKISKPTFDRWLTLLKRVPDSVLWLLSGTEASHENLRTYALTQGIAKERLIFAEKKPNPEHLARYPLADLFVDSSPYGAHTTASDALFMGVPVVTFSGRSFASRVCGSLVRAAGLPELACANAKDYVDKAVALGKDSAARQRYRDKLAASRGTCDLFNMPKLVSHLEALYGQMWADFETGALPQPDLANLDVYLEVGAAWDHDAEEMQALSAQAYLDRWRDALAKRHAYRPIPADHRFWREEARKEKAA